MFLFLSYTLTRTDRCPAENLLWDAPHSIHIYNNQGPRSWWISEICDIFHSDDEIRARFAMLRYLESWLGSFFFPHFFFRSLIPARARSDLSRGRTRTPDTGRWNRGYMIRESAIRSGLEPRPANRKQAHDSRWTTKFKQYERKQKRNISIIGPFRK